MEEVLPTIIPSTKKAKLKGKVEQCKSTLAEKISQPMMNRIEEKGKSSQTATMDLMIVTTSPVFKCIPRSRRSEGQPPFIEDKREVQPRRLENGDLQVLKEDVTILLPNLQLIFRDETQKSIKSLRDQTKKELFPIKKIDEGFNPKAYKLLAKAGYDFISSSQLGELSPETTGAKMHGLNETQRKLKQQGYAVKHSMEGLGFIPFEPIKISTNTNKTKASTQHIIVEYMDESSRSNSPPQISVFDQIEAPIVQALVFTRLGNLNQVERNLAHIPQRSIQQRIDTLSQKSWRGNPNMK